MSVSVVNRGISSLNWNGLMVSKEATALILFTELKSYLEIIFCMYKKQTVKESRK